MIPSVLRDVRLCWGIPRESGDDPEQVQGGCQETKYSPRERG